MTKKNYVTSQDKKNHATSWDKKISRNISGQKIHATYRDEKKKIHHLFEENNFTQPLRTKKKTCNLLGQKNHATS